MFLNGNSRILNDLILTRCIVMDYCFFVRRCYLQLGYVAYLVAVLR
jgi:hypothetical protein